jgi:hypothetical protein
MLETCIETLTLKSYRPIHLKHPNIYSYLYKSGTNLMHVMHVSVNSSFGIIEYAPYFYVPNLPETTTIIIQYTYIV